MSHPRDEGGAAPDPAAHEHPGGTHADGPEPDGSGRWSGEELSLLIGSVALITLTAFEALATTTVMPGVVEDLDAQSWFSLASGAALAAQLLAVVVAGGLADARGAGPVLVGGLGLFVVGLALCASAPHVAVFVAGRLIQGLGGGLIIVPLYVLIGAVSTDAHRPTFFAAFSLAWVLPSLVGPAIAGIVAQTLGWRWVFGAVPVLALLASAVLVPRLRGLPHTSRPVPRRLARLGAWALAGGIGLVLLQLAGALGGVSLGAFTLIGCVLVVLALPRLVPRGTWRLARGIPAVVATRFLALGALQGATAFLPLVLQRVHHWSEAAAALAVTIGSVSWSLGSVAQARIVGRRRRERLPLLGAVLMTAGIAPVAFLVVRDAPVWPALLGWFVAGFGIGMLHSTLSDLTLGMSQRSEHGKVSSWLQVADASGPALELALVSVALAVWTPALVGGAATGGFAYLPASLLALVVGAGAIVAATRIPRG